MSHSGHEPKPTENNGKISLRAATNFSKLYGKQNFVVPTGTGWAATLVPSRTGQVFGWVLLQGSALCGLARKADRGIMDRKIRSPIRIRSPINPLLQQEELPKLP